MMNDLISRQAAIDALGDEPEVWTGRDEYAQGLNNQWHYDVNALKAVPSAQPKAIRPKFVAEDRYIKNHFSIYPYCPKCNYELETGDCYCKVCGCHIDWSEDDVPRNGL